jgi:N-acetylglutamate synthase-like GNAT family acetyltransferase
MSWVSTRIAEHHQLDGFDCGVDSLNRWLVESARRADQQGTARTYVWTESGQSRVVAYFAITPTRVDREEDRLSRGASGGLDRVPAFLIAKLAIDKSIAGSGNGRQLVLDAISRILGAAQLGGGRLVVADAVDDRAAAFYRKMNFLPVRDRPHWLYMKVATARAAFGFG